MMIKNWWKRLWCHHDWESNGGIQKYVGTFGNSYFNERNYVTRQGFYCKKCDKWKVDEKRYGIYYQGG
jgi:hypothetical protein